MSDNVQSQIFRDHIQRSESHPLIYVAPFYDSRGAVVETVVHGVLTT